jgi:ABC-type bacteriocin/lantibiotic exporter with double-glycine peptidase domain
MTEPPEDDSKTRNLTMKIEHFLSDKRLNTIVPLVTLVLFAVIIYQQILMLARISQFLFWFIIIDILVVFSLSLPFLEKHIQRVLKR